MKMFTVDGFMQNYTRTKPRTFLFNADINSYSNFGITKCILYQPNILSWNYLVYEHAVSRQSL
jgi:hypothetical protein